MQQPDEIPRPDADPPAAAILRREFREARRQLGATAAERAAAAALTLSRLQWWLEARSVGVYLPADGELDTGPATDACRARGVDVHLPVLDGDRLTFACWDADTEWSVNRYGIAEPRGRAPIDPASLDAVLVPAVAVDRRGNRLGMGAGWYDRTFARRPRDEVDPVGRATGTKLVAFVYTEQLVEHLDPRPWDVAMDAIVTPDELLILRR